MQPEDIIEILNDYKKDTRFIEDLFDMDPVRYEMQIELDKLKKKWHAKGFTSGLRRAVKIQTAMNKIKK